VSGAPSKSGATRVAGARPDSLKVIVATIMGPEGITGVQTHIHQVCDFLSQHGDGALLVTPYSWGGALSIPVFGARRLIDRLSAQASIAWYRRWHYEFLKHALKRELAKLDEAVVYAQCTLSAKAAMEARRGPFQKVVVAIHSDGSQADEWVDKGMLTVSSREYRSIRELEQRVLTAVDGIVYVSDAARRGIGKAVEGLDNVASKVIHSFVRMPREIVPDPSVGGDLVSVGGLELAKNHEYLFHVLIAANKRGHRFSLDLIGEGINRKPLENAIKELGLKDQVRILGSRSDVKSILPQYKVYVHSSIRESLCLAIIEAMGSGLGVIAGAVGGVPELFEPGVEGLFWPLDNSDAAAEILIALMEDDAMRARLGAAARLRFAHEFDAEAVGTSLEQFLESVRNDSSRAVDRARTSA